MTKQLKQILPTLIKKDQEWHITLLSNWNTIMGNLACRVRLEKIEHESLVLGVYDACWMQELYLLSPLLITTINQNLDQPRIKYLRFKRSVAKKRVEKNHNELPNKTAASITLTAEQKAALHRIKDPQLKIALERFLIRCHKEKV